MATPSTARDRRMDAALEALREHWGHPGFRPAQVPVIGDVLAGRDVLAVLPTGGGKSVCFQVPAVVTEGLTLVVSPLISLMEDQVAAARRRGLRADALTSAMDPEASRATVARLDRHVVDLLYVSPERLNTATFRSILGDVRVRRLVVDEAHCISEWGHDFRPAYRRIADAYGWLDRPQVAAFTATATPDTRRDIVESLRLERPALHVHPVDRPNLRWRAERLRSLQSAASRVVQAARHRRGASIVYAGTRLRAVRIAEALRRLGVTSAAYHAGMPSDVRSRVQERFLAGETRTVVATNAFGMGVDHPEVRLVCHLGIPGSPEAYLQEAGRAGRDGLPADCLLVSHRGDVKMRRRFVARSWPSPRSVARLWRSLPAECPCDLDEIGGTGSRRKDDEETQAALRLLIGFGVVRVRHVAGSGTRVVRGPASLESRIDLGAVRRGRREAKRRIRAVRRYVRTRRCRRAYLAAYFDESPPACAGCDVCG